ncbi:MAG TPA: hypothetical protein VFP60_19860 [Pseudolabrys sp.]|nr:hypothetical protein [Pseudolabrys sp.]
MIQLSSKWGTACLAVVFLQATAAGAVDLEGAWASDASACEKIFQVKNKVISIRRDSDLHGSGFILDRNQLRGKMAKCAVKSRKEEANLVNMIAVCSTDIALSTVQFSLRLDSENQLTRVFPGIPEMSVSYSRCRF